VTLSIKKIVVIQFALTALLAVSAAAEPISVLFISGRNNHKWKLTTPALKKMMEDSGRFKVDVTEKPAEITAKMLEGYDLIFNGWTGFPKKTGHLWGLDTEKAIDDFVAGGKGLASFHAGSSSFHDWDGFQKIIGAVWGKGTGHGKYHEFTVTVTDTQHPITKGMKSFKTSDELWHKMAVLQPTPGRKVLCTALSSKDNRGTGENEAVAICTTFGKGRGFYTSLGHDVKALNNPGCKMLMLRGLEWAATGKVTIAQIKDTDAPTPKPGKVKIPPVLAATATYKYSGDRAVLTAAKDYLQKAGKDPETRKTAAAQLALMLKSDATGDCKRFICQQLSRIGSAAQAPVLASLLSDEDLATDAQAALTVIPGKDTLAAMRQMLGASKPAVTGSLITILAQRRDVDSVEAIGKHIGAKNPNAETAIDALGKIGGTKAVAILIKSDGKLSDDLQFTLNAALLECAYELADAGKTAEAAKIYVLLLTPDRPKHVRRAAFPGVVAAQKAKAAPLIISTIAGKDKVLRSAAIGCLRDFKSKEITVAVAAELGSLPPAQQRQLIGVLADRQDTAALPAVSALATNKNDEVRHAALIAMGQLGNEATVKPLLAATSNPTDRETVRSSFSRLKGAGVDDALIAALGADDPTIRVEAAAILNLRDAKKAATPLLKTASTDTDAAVRKEALKAIGSLADSKMCESLADLMPKAKKSSELRGIINAIITITRVASEADAATTTKMLGEKFTASKDAKIKSAILIVASGVGGSDSLKIVRAATKDTDIAVRTAAVRAMSSWTDAEPLADLLTVAKNDTQAAPKILALRGIVSLSSRAKDVPAEKLVAIYAEAMKLASSASDTKTLLSGLGAIASKDALAMVLPYLDNKETVNEAAMAVITISEKLAGSEPAAVKAAIAKATAACKLKFITDKAAKIIKAIDTPTSKTKASSSATSTAPPAAGAKFAWKETDNSVALTNDGKIVWKMNHDPTAGKPYIHPLATTDGSVLTWNRPADHVWHRALWFSWKMINGLNYWEENRQGLSQGRTEIKNIKATLNKDSSAKFEIILSYHPPKKPEILAEKRTILFSAPAKDGRYKIDWTSVFTATGADAVLDRTPIKGEKGGKGWGGYAGLSIRMAKETRGWNIIDSKGRKDMKIHGQPGAVWVDASGKTTSGKEAGVAIFDHPSNTRHPSPWYIAKGMPYFSPALLYNKPLTLKKSASMTLKYRIVVHPGMGSAKMLDEEFKTFSKN
jgi:type 1 glutamine amidotransferase/HEAT repeat protein